MRVVLDSTEFVADYHMTGNAFRVLWPALNRMGAKLSVPSVVIEEVANHYREALVSLCADAERLQRKSQKLRRAPLTNDQIDIDSEAAKYRNDLTRRLADVNAEILPYPTVAHGEIVRRAVTRRRPFKESGAGYRDTLIWLSIVELANAIPDSIAFVSANTRDFADGDKLHPTLAADLGLRPLPAMPVRYFDSLEKFNDAVILPTLKRIKGLIGDFADEGAPAGRALRRWLRSNLGDEIAPYDDALAPFELLYGSASIFGTPTIERVTIDDVRLLDGPNQVLVSVTADAEIPMSLDIEWDDYEESSEIRRFVGPSERFDSLATDTDVDASVAMSLVMNPETFQVLASEVDEIGVGSAMTQYNPHPRRSSKSG